MVVADADLPEREWSETAAPDYAPRNSRYQYPLSLIVRSKV